MSGKEQESALREELNKVIDRFRLEYEITYAQTFGVLDIIKYELLREAYDDDQNEWGAH